MRKQLTRSIILFDPSRPQSLAEAGAPVPPRRRSSASDGPRGAARHLLGVGLLGAFALFAPLLRCLH